MNWQVLIFSSFLSLALSLLACRTEPKTTKTVEESPNLAKVDTLAPTLVENNDSTVINLTETPNRLLPIDYDTSQWSEVIRLDSNFILNLKYAEEDNFVQKQLYDCPRCFLRPDAAQALLQVEKELLEQGLTIVLFDCYRPHPIQQELWDIMPHPGYVTDPKKGSMHNRGLAVDLTLAHIDGDTLEMGTHFDYFGPRGHHSYMDLPDHILANRQLLKNTMAKYGFKGIRTEWWHYSFRSKIYPLDDMEWPCLSE